MTSAQLRELSRQLVRQLGMLDKDCGDIALPPIQAHTLIELEQQPLTVNQLADKELGYQHMYLETTECLNAVVKLYEKLGFEHLDSAWGETGHDACEVVMAKML